MPLKINQAYLAPKIVYLIFGVRFVYQHACVTCSGIHVIAKSMIKPLNVKFVRYRRWNHIDSFDNAQLKRHSKIDSVSTWEELVFSARNYIWRWYKITSENLKIRDCSIDGKFSHETIEISCNIFHISQGAKFLLLMDSQFASHVI